MEERRDAWRPAREKLSQDSLHHTRFTPARIFRLRNVAEAASSDAVCGSRHRERADEHEAASLTVGPGDALHN